VLEKSVSGTAVFLIDENSHKSQLAGFFPDPVVERLFAIEFPGALGKLAHGEISRGFNNVLLFSAQFEIHAASLRRLAGRRWVKRIQEMK